MKYLYKPTQKRAVTHLQVLLPLALPKPLLPFRRGMFFSVFADEKNFLNPPPGTYILLLCGIWPAPKVEPGQRIPRMFPCVQLVGDDLPLQQTSPPVVVVGLATETSSLSSRAQTRELQLNLSKQKQLQLWGNQEKGGRQVPSTGNHWTGGWSERYWNLVRDNFSIRPISAVKDLGNSYDRLAKVLLRVKSTWYCDALSSQVTFGARAPKYWTPMAIMEEECKLMEVLVKWKWNWLSLTF